MNPPTIPPATGLRAALSREIKTGELLRALIVVGPMVAAYFIARETALPDADQAGPDSTASVSASATERREIIKTSLTKSPDSSGIETT